MIKILAMSNHKNHNFFKFKIDSNEDESKTTQYLDFIIELCNQLNIKQYLDLDLEIQPLDYKYWRGTHQFVENSKFKIHILFEENYVNMIVICSFENRKKLIEILRKHCNFSIVEI